jgi:hypothetical protein
VAGAGLLDTVYGTAAGPCPETSALIDTHSDSAEIDQLQSRAVEMATEPSPPLAVKEEGLFSIDSWHLSEVGDVTEVDAAVQRIDRSALKTAAASAGP